VASLAELIDGFDHVETASEFERRLKKGKPLRIKFGLDPTSSDLHLGHTVILSRLQRFIDAGHQAILLIGDFTARIGDPSGRNESRPAITDEQIAVNMKTYAEQAGKVIDLERVELRYNSEWLAKLGLDNLIKLLSHVTVAQMLKREDFSKRYDAGVPISLHEFLYPVAQAYDSVALKADVELGGNDQLFNLLMGRHYQTMHEQEAQICLTAPILEGIDGIKKMSKSLGNFIGVTEAAEEQFGKTMRIPDELIGRWHHLILDMPASQAAALNTAIIDGSAHPMNEKKALAQAIVRRFHGDTASDRALANFERTVQRGEAPKEMRVLEVTPQARVTELLVQAGFAESKRAAQRLIAGGGVRLDGTSVSDAAAQIGSAEAVLSVGTRQFVKVQPTP
jgi:tyrosyl-tRNA synthetase